MKNQFPPEKEGYIFDEKTFLKIDAEYKRQLSARVSTALQMRARAGWFPGRPPLGYETRWRRKERPRSIVCISSDRNSVERVRREFILAAQGRSLREIQEQLVLEAFITADKLTNWELRSLRRKLLNPFYSGSFLWAGIEYQGKHELIPDVADAARLIQSQVVLQ